MPRGRRSKKKNKPYKRKKEIIWYILNFNKNIKIQKSFDKM